LLQRGIIVRNRCRTVIADGPIDADVMINGGGIARRCGLVRASDMPEDGHRSLPARGAQPIERTNDWYAIRQTLPIHVYRC
jgi:hypothetical protein